MPRNRTRLLFASLLAQTIGLSGCVVAPTPSYSLTNSQVVTRVQYRPSSPQKPHNPESPTVVSHRPTDSRATPTAYAPRASTLSPVASAKLVAPVRSPKVATPVSFVPNANAPELLPTVEETSNTFPLDLATALAMTDNQNPQVALARERINEAYAQLQRANVLWLPSLRAGVNYNKHEGTIQDVAGTVFNTSRGSVYTGLGANAVGAGSPSVPGVYANFHTSDAYFQPRIAENVVAAREASAEANTNDLLLQTALSYLELLRAEQERAIARELVQNTRQLVALTSAYAQSGQGLQSDDDRAQTELALRENDLARTDELVQTASARLAQQLRLDPTTSVAPQEPTVLPLHLTHTDIPLSELVATGLGNRPEVAENRHLVNEAVFRLRREQYAPLIPSVLLGISHGGLGGGLGGRIDNFGDRLDADAVAFWELRNLGLGERAARCEANSRLEQARLRQVANLDKIAREVVEAHAQVRARQRTIATSQRSIELATSSLDRNLARIKNAEGLPLEVLQSIQALGTALREYLRSVLDYNAAQFQLLRAVGGSPYEFAPVEAGN